MKKENSVSILPLDLVVEIFKRLPAKSLMRFKCLSKQYASIIESQNFIDSFYSHTSTKKQNFLFSFRNKEKEKLMFYSAKPHIDESFSPLSTIIDNNISRIRTPPVRGLICYSTINHQHVICNPSTRQCFRLPQNEYWKDQEYYEDILFGYEPISNRLKVMSIIGDRKTEYEFWIFTVGDGKSWRKIENVPYLYRPIVSKCINGVLYYTVRVDTKPVVISFDLKFEKFNLFKLPPDVLKMRKLIEFQEKLAFIDTHDDDIRVWVFENNEWSKMYWTIEDYSVWNFSQHKAAGICDGEIVFVPSSVYYPFVTHSFNLKKKTLARVEIPIPLHDISMNYGRFPNYVESIGFI